MLVGNDVGGMIAWSVAGSARRRCAPAVIRAPHPLRMRRSILRVGADRPGRRRMRSGSSSCPASRSDGSPRTTRSSATSSTAGAGPPGETDEYEVAVAQYAEAMRLHPTAHCALEFFRWVVRSLPRPDGRRAAAGGAASDHTACPADPRPRGRVHPAVHRARLGSTSPVSTSGACSTGSAISHQEEAPGEVSKHLVRWAALD